MATEFDNALHWGLFLTGTTLTGETGKYVRVSELVLSALRATGVFSNMVDGIVAPDIDRLWLDKNFDPAILKEWDATGASWVPMTYGRLFGRAAVDKLAVTGGTGNAVVVSQPAGFQAARLYLMTPLADNSGAATINVSGVGTYPVKYGDGSDLGAVEFKAGRQAVLFFTGTRFEVLFPLALMSAAVVAAQASADAAAASALLSQKYAANPEDVEVGPGLYSSRHYLAKVIAYWSLITNTLGGWIHGATDKPTPTGADEIGIADSAGGLWGLKKLSLANLAGWLSSLTQTLTNKTLDAARLIGTITHDKTDPVPVFGPILDVFWDRIGAATNVVYQVAISTRSSTNVKRLVAAWGAAVSSVTNGAENVTFYWQTITGGTLATRMQLGAGLFTANATGGDKGSDTINAKGFYVDGVLIPFQKEFVSGLQTVTAAGRLTIAHGLGFTPKLIIAELVLTAAVGGYANGDVIEYTGAPVAFASFGYGQTIRKTTVNIEVQYGDYTSGIYWLHVRNTGAPGGIPNNQVQIRFKAYG